MSAPEPVPALVVLHLWRVPRAQVAASVVRTALDRGLARRVPGVRFAKALGTGRGRTFAARDADLTRWGLLTTWASAEEAAAFDAAPVVRRWDRVAVERARVDLRPLSSTGRWSGREPFGRPVPVRHDGPVAALTRARLTASGARAFWAAVPAVVADLHGRDGLVAAVPVGEAPVALQGTFTLWRDAAALRDFAHRGAAHTDVVRRTPQARWYAEDLFARFAVVGGSGTVDGRAAW